MANKTIKTKLFNIFDLFIVLIIIFCIVAIVFKFAFIKNDTTFTESKNVSFTVDEILKVTADNIVNTFKPYQVLYLSNSGENIGSIKTLTKENAKLYVGDGDQVTLVSNPEKYNLVGTATLYGKQGANYFLRMPAMWR